MTYSAICPGCNLRFDPPNPRGFIDIRRCPACQAKEREALHHHVNVRAKNERLLQCPSRMSRRSDRLENERPAGDLLD